MIQRVALALLLLLSLGCDDSASPSPEARASHSFATEWHNWSQGLTTDGEAIGQMVVDAVNGSPVERDQFEAGLSEFEKKVSDKAHEYEGASLPTVSELQSYRDLVVGYLKWQGSVPMAAMRDVMDLATNAQLTDISKREQIMEIMTRTDEQEREWKDRMDDAAAVLEAWVKRNG